MRVPYGSSELNLPLEGYLGPAHLTWPEPRTLDDANALATLEGGANRILTLSEDARGTDASRAGEAPWSDLLTCLPAQCERPVLVVPDATRKGVWQGLLSGLLTHLLERWPAAKLSLLVANGIHKPVDGASLRRHLRWDSLPASLDRALKEGRLSAVQHDASGSLENVGTTRRGTPVRLNPLYLHSDARILLGGTSFHYFAGYGGGPKLVFPGVGGGAGILQNHLLALDKTTGSWTPTCAPSVLDGNPVADDLAEAASMSPPDALILPLGLPGNRAAVSVWDRSGWTAGFRKGCDLYRSLHEIDLAEPLDGVVADAGGEPRDKHLLQVHKSLQHAVRFAKPGGWILLVGACGDGEGSAHLVDLVGQLMERSIEEILRDGGESFHLQTAVALRSATEGRPVGFLSQLSRTAPDRIRSLGWEPLPDEAAAAGWLKVRGGGRWGHLSEADTVIPAPRD